MGPLAAEGAAGFVALVPVAVGGATGRAPPVRPPRRAAPRRHASSRMRSLVARHRLARTCRSGCRPGGSTGRCAASRSSRCRRGCRADHLEPALADMLGQRLAGRDAAAQPVGAGAGADARDAPAAPRTASARRRRSSGDARCIIVEHRIRGRPVGQQHRGGADRHREGHANCRAHRRRTAWRPRTSGRRGGCRAPARRRCRRWPQAGMDVAHPLRRAGRARRIEPERDLVGRAFGRWRGSRPAARKIGRRGRGSPTVRRAAVGRATMMRRSSAGCRSTGSNGAEQWRGDRPAPRRGCPARM